MIFEFFWDSKWLWPTIALTTQKLNNLFQNLQGDKDLNNPINSWGWEIIDFGKKIITGCRYGSFASTHWLYFDYFIFYAFSY